MDHPISSAMEDYLKALFELGETGVKTQTLADALSVSPASATNMLKKLARLKLVAHEKYYGSSLTEAGRLVALETLRHHRLLETYLAQALGYAWHEVHDEAERLEHVISEDFERRIAAKLGHPSFDPHGDPIPQPDGSLPERCGRPLTEFGVGEAVTLTRFKRQDAALLERLAEQGLRPGQQVTLLEPSDTGTLSVKAEGAEVKLELDLAQSIDAARQPPEHSERHLTL